MRNKPIILLFIFMTLFFMSIRWNSFKIAPSYFDIFQVDSEDLVLGKIVEDKYFSNTGNTANLFRIYIDDFTSIHNSVYIGIHFLKNKKLDDYILLPFDLTDANWTHGYSNNFLGFLLKNDSKIDSYIGRIVYLPTGESGILSSIVYDNQYRKIRLSEIIQKKAATNGYKKIIISGSATLISKLKFWPYCSQFGIQGIIFSYLYNKIGISIDGIYTLVSILFSITMTVICFIFFKIISLPFAICFACSVLLSPWLTLFGKNLYWIPFSWFLPAVFSGLIVIFCSKKSRIILLILCYMSFLFKCLAGYEYITTTILFASSFFALDFFYRKFLSRKESLCFCFLICFVGTISFFTALAIHANLRFHGNIIDGLHQIYELDVKRRTYGQNPNLYLSNKEMFDSLTATPLCVLSKYILQWKTNFFAFLPIKFYTFLVIDIFIILYQLIITKKIPQTLWIFIIYFFVDISWFVAAKSHSYIHTHLNYVLWYFGFSGITMYLTLKCFILASNITTKLFLAKQKSLLWLFWKDT